MAEATIIRANIVLHVVHGNSSWNNKLSKREREREREREMGLVRDSPAAYRSVTLTANDNTKLRRSSREERCYFVTKDTRK